MKNFKWYRYIFNTFYVPANRWQRVVRWFKVKWNITLSRIFFRDYVGKYSLPYKFDILSVKQAPIKKCATCRHRRDGHCWSMKGLCITDSTDPSTPLYTNWEPKEEFTPLRLGFTTRYETLFRPIKIGGIFPPPGS